MAEILADTDGLPPRQALVVSGSLVVGLLVVNYFVGIPQTARDWLLLGSTIFLAPALGYYIAVRKFNYEFVIVLGVFLFTLSLAITSTP